MERRAAILVIHGIGEQRPYEALDAFVQGLAKRLGVVPGRMSHRLVWRAGRSESAIRIPVGSPVDREGATTLDLYEFYWADRVERRMGLWRVAAWIARTSLTPLRRWATNPLFLTQENHGRVFLLLRELLRAVTLIAIAAALFVPPVVVALQWRAFGRTLGAAWGAIDGAAHPWALAVWLAAVVMALFLLRSWRLLLRRTRGQSCLESRALVWWRSATLAVAAALLLIAWGLDHFSPAGPVTVLVELAAALSDARVAALLSSMLVFVVLRPFLVNYVGDVALYVNEDERARSFRTRGEILAASVRRLRALLRDPEYCAVHVAGHSLGSVIAYDTISRIVREVRSEPDTPDRLQDKEFEKLQGLLTFGSPLDKIQYFFRTDVSEGQAVRAQILSSLHGFRRRSSGRDYGDARLERYVMPVPQRFCWVNVHSRADLVSGSLDYFDLDRQVAMPYLNPLTAHLRYWTDPGFYEAVETWLRMMPRKNSASS